MDADRQLLERFATGNSEAAFREIVERHLRLVYAAALRQVRDPHWAEDVTQVVFANLARRARSLPRDLVLARWLHRDTRHRCLELLRKERRRVAREQESIAVNLPEPVTPMQQEALCPHLDAALDHLPAADRDALLLRFFQERTFDEVGAALGISADAARKRVDRGLERLRTVLAKRGILSASAGLSAALAAASAVAPPVALGASVARAALLGAEAARSGFAATVSQFMNGPILKTASIGAIGAVAVAVISLQHLQIRDLRDELAVLRHGVAVNPPKTAAPKAGAARESVSATELARWHQDRMELMRLRGEVTRLRAEPRDAPSPAQPVADGEEEIQLQRQNITLESRFAEAPAAMLKGFEITPGSGAPRILTDSQSRVLVRALEETPGVDLLTAPKVTTLHQRDARIDVTQTNDFNGIEVKIGPELRVKPQLHGDFQSITLNLDAELTEIVPAESENDGRPKSIRRTTVTGTPTLQDGQTVVLAQWLNNERPRGHEALAHGRCLLVFVTPTLIDSAGNRIHTSEEPGPP